MVQHNGLVEADIPLEPLNDQAPLYHRPTSETAKQAPINSVKVEDRVGLTGALWKLIECPDIASRAWVWDQYDSTVGGQTVKRPGAADAAVVKLEGLSRALALTTDCTPRYCAADPEEGGKRSDVRYVVVHYRCSRKDSPSAALHAHLRTLTPGFAIVQDDIPDLSGNCYIRIFFRTTSRIF